MPRVTAPLNDGLAQGVQGVELAAFGRDGGVDGGTTGIQIGGDAVLLGQGRQREIELRKLRRPIDTRHFCAVSQQIAPLNKPWRRQAIKQKAARNALRFEREDFPSALAIELSDVILFKIGAQFSEKNVSRFEYRHVANDRHGVAAVQNAARARLQIFKFQIVLDLARLISTFTPQRSHIFEAIEVPTLWQTVQKSVLAHAHFAIPSNIFSASFSNSQNLANKSLAGVGG